MLGFLSKAHRHLWNTVERVILSHWVSSQPDLLARESLDCFSTVQMTQHHLWIILSLGEMSISQEHLSQNDRSSQQNLWSKNIMNMMSATAARLLAGAAQITYLSHTHPCQPLYLNNFLHGNALMFAVLQTAKLPALAQNTLLHCTISVLSRLSDTTCPGFSQVRADIRPCRISGHIVREKIKFFKLGSLFLNRSKADMPKRASCCLPLTCHAIPTSLWAGTRLAAWWMQGVVNTKGIILH